MVYNLLQIMFRKLTTITNKSLIRAQATHFAQRTANSANGSENSDLDNPLIEKILKKSQGGRTLALNVTKSTNLDQYEREQRYEVFINKMNQLYFARRAFLRKLNKSSKRMRRSHLLFQTPLKQCLSDYAKMTVHGFNDEMIATFLENLNGVIQAQGNKAMAYNDYTISEMDQSWRMDKVAEDLKWGLSHEFSFFSPANQARASKALGEIGYKNTEVINLWLKDLHKKLEDDGTVKFTSNPEFDSIVYGGMKGFNPKHYVFQGFQNDQEFSDHLQTLMEFRANEGKKKKGKKSQSAVEVEKAMHTVIEAAKEIKGLQVDQQAGIEALRQQFFKLQQAQNKHEFLQQNKYIVFDMLELQELLVKGGYMGPEEALLGAAESTEQRMERATNVFYDLVLNHSPELLSPQYEEFYDAATENEKPVRNYATEKHNTMRLYFISDILVGLAEQAQSQRRCALDKDYPNEYYEKMLMPEEFIGRNPVADQQTKIESLRKTPYVMMEQSYLNGWRNFADESGKMIKSHFNRLIHEESSCSGLLKGLRALSACKYEARGMRDKIVSKALRNQKSSKPQAISTQAGIDGLQGMGNCGYAPEGQDQLISRIVYHLNKRQFTFSQKFELLNGMALLASKDPSIVDLPLFKRVMAEVDAIVYEGIDNDLTYKQYIQLNEVHETLKQLGKPTFANESLRAGVANKHAVGPRFGEHNAEGYDPLKSKVVSGLAKGLNFQELTKMKTQQEFSEYAADLSIKPDIMTGYKGDNLAIYVLNNRQTMHDTMTADGRTNHFMSLTPGVKPVAISMDSIIEYDLQQFKLKIKDDFDLNELLGGKKVAGKKQYAKFARFAGNITKNYDQNVVGNFSQFFDQLSEFFRMKARLDIQHEPSQLCAANDELKLALIKIQLYHDSKLNPQEQAMVHTASGSSFQQLMDDLKKVVIEQGKEWAQKQNNDPLDKRLDLSWQGTRQSVELPNRKTANTKKAVEPELISTRFLQHGSYHHYDDWKQLMKETYDQFNLMELKDSGITVNYDPAQHYRRVPKGIFPLPNSKRQVMDFPGKQQPVASNIDRFVEFEKDSHNYMLEQELKLSKSLKPVTPEVSMITNLQNIKYALLADRSDRKICQEMLLKMDYTEKLIYEHLTKQKTSTQPKSVPRDPSSFRKYMESVPSQQSAFNQFYLNEGQKQARAKEIFEKVQEKHSQNDGSELEQLADELDRILMKNERENEDLFNVGSPLANYVNVHVDIDSLGVLEKREQSSSGLTDAEFLMRQRCVAESRMIKSKIIYKLDQDIKLTELEEQYLVEWKKAMRKNKTIIQDCMVPKQPSKLMIKNLSDHDISQFNKLPRVQLSNKLHGEFGLNDLVLEVSQVFDNQAVRAVELTCKQETMKSEWQFGKDFKLVNKRNKEIDSVLAQYEEIAFRAAGQFTDKDIGHIKQMFLVGRNFDKFDREYLETDIKSLEHFIEDVNPYDTRIQMLETWLYRKEEEMNSRVNLPTPELRQSDRTIHQKLEVGYKAGRARLVAHILDKPQDQKSYDELTGEKLHELVESLSIRLNLFEREYPSFLPYAVKGIMEHPNLSRADHATLDAYCKLFHLDWRGDTTIANREEFMATHPIYLHPKDQPALLNKMTNQSVSAALKRACQPYLEDLANKILKH